MYGVIVHVDSIFLQAYACSSLYTEYPVFNTMVLTSAMFSSVYYLKCVNTLVVVSLSVYRSEGKDCGEEKQ